LINTAIVAERDLIKLDFIPLIIHFTTAGQTVSFNHGVAYNYQEESPERKGNAIAFSVSKKSRLPGFL